MKTDVSDNGGRRTMTRELGRFVQPIVRTLDFGFGHLHWGLTALFGVYLLSGTTQVKADEVAVVLRFGRLAGGSLATAVHGSGLLFTLPRPMDEIIRVSVKKVYEIDIHGLHYRRSGKGYAGSPTTGAIDPTLEGYCLTGDENIVQADMVARYMIHDPVAFALNYEKPEALLNDAVMSATVHTAGEMKVDSVLSERRSEFVAMIVTQAQARLDAVDSGITLTGVEMVDLAPPRGVREEFTKVQNAFINMETRIKEARKKWEEDIPKAQAESTTKISEAEAYAAEILGKARGDAAAWQALEAEYRQNPKVVRERLYREGMEKALGSAGSVNLLPPPTGGRYQGSHISVPRGK